MRSVGRVMGEGWDDIHRCISFGHFGKGEENRGYWMVGDGEVRKIFCKVDNYDYEDLGRGMCCKKGGGCCGCMMGIWVGYLK